MEQVVDCGFDLVFGNQYDIIDVLLNNREGDGLQVDVAGNAIGDRRKVGHRQHPAGFQGMVDRRGVLSLNADHSHRRAKLFNGSADSCGEAAATDRYDDGVNVRSLLQDFKGETALSKHHQLVVVG